MSQLNANYQEIIANSNSNNNSTNTIENVAGTAIITSEALQGLSMANQFAICTNHATAPIILSCLSPILLPTLGNTTKGSFELSSQDNRGQNGGQVNQPQTVHIQLASPFTIANSAQTLPSLGLSYINLSSLGAAGGAIPIQLTLNNPNNQQIHLPVGAISGLNQDIQLTQNYQVKYEPDVSSTTTQQQSQQHQQLSITSNCVSNIAECVSTDSNNKIKRKARRRIPNKPNKGNRLINGTDSDNNSQNNQQSAASIANNQEERLLDHKGRPFIYNCPNCPKKFTLNSRLTAHLRCHTGIRPYTCVQCGFSFTQKSYLIRHAAVHTEDRPFTCERCLKTYKHYGSLANHRKLHRKEDKGLGGALSSSEDLLDSNDDHLKHHHLPDSAATAATALVTTTNLDGVLQMHHSDWSTAVSTINNNNDNNNTYIITTTSDTTANVTYYSDASVLSGTGPVAFPDQQLTPTVVGDGAGGGKPDRNHIKATNQTHHQQQQPVFLDVQLLQSSSTQPHSSNEAALIYTRFSNDHPHHPHHPHPQQQHQISVPSQSHSQSQPQQQSIIFTTTV